jgi:sugar O-acyltransferase (sialic acid O-acetyltransferase NeuD family)
MILSEILVPLLNANEPEAKLVEIHVVEGQAVKKGNVLFTIETTKAATDIEAPLAGFIRIFSKVDDTLAVGDKLAVITDTVDEPLEVEMGTRVIVSNPNIRITRPAMKLASLLGVDIQMLPKNQLVTEEVVQKYSGVQEVLNTPISKSEKPSLVIYGAGGHAKTILEMAYQIDEYNIIGILDDDQALAGKIVLGIPVLGSRALLPALKEQGVDLAANGVGGILDINVRMKVFDLLEKAGYGFPRLIHPRAAVEKSARIDEGVQVFANAYIGTDATLSSKCMINTNAVISHDCEIGSYSHIAPGALLAGHVQVGERTLIGMGVTITIGIKIGSGVRIGNGATVLADVPDKMMIHAGKLWVGKVDR